MKRAITDSAWHMWGMHIRCSFLATVYLHNQKQQVLSVATVLSPAEDMAWISWYQWYQSSQVNSLSVCECPCTHACVQALHVVPAACCVLSCCYGIHLSCTTVLCYIWTPSSASSKVSFDQGARHYVCPMSRCLDPTGCDSRPRMHQESFPSIACTEDRSLDFSR